MSRIVRDTCYSLCEQQFEFVLDSRIKDSATVAESLNKIEGVLQVEIVNDGCSVRVLAKNSLTDDEVARIRSEVIFVLSGVGCISIDPYYVQ